MRNPAALNAAYEASPLVARNAGAAAEIRRALVGIQPHAYRGVERCPLAEAPDAYPGWAGQAEEIGRQDQIDREARRQLVVILGPDHQCEHYPCHLVSTLAEADALKRVVDCPADYEIVRLSTDDSDGGGERLGYDVGYWGGGNYSILCDSVLWPVWHPPPREALPMLAGRVASLNAHMLFPDRRFAVEFRLSFQEGLGGSPLLRQGQAKIRSACHLLSDGVKLLVIGLVLGEGVYERTAITGTHRGESPDLRGQADYSRFANSR